MPCCKRLCTLQKRNIPEAAGIALHCWACHHRLVRSRHSTWQHATLQHARSVQPSTYIYVKNYATMQNTISLKPFMLPASCRHAPPLFQPNCATHIDTDKPYFNKPSAHPTHTWPPRSARPEQKGARVGFGVSILVV